MLNNLTKLSKQHGGDLIPLIIPSELTNGDGLCNVSVFVEKNGDVILNIRHVHYTLYHSTINQKYYCGWGCLAYLNPEDDMTLTTGNYLCKLNSDLQIEHFNKIDTSNNDIKPIWEFVGLEDARVFRWDNKLYVCGVRRDTKSDGEGRMELCQIDWTKDKCTEVTRHRINPPEFTHLEKNWMPVLDKPYHFVNWPNPTKVYKADPNHITKVEVPSGIIDVIPSEVIINKTEKITVENDNISQGVKLNAPLSLRGGSQVITLGDYYICCVHETHWWNNDLGCKDASYNHRFIFWDKNWNYVKISEPFKFMDGQIEFCCGLAEKNDDLLISFGFVDNAAYILRMPKTVLNKLNYTTSFDNE
tara:strand:+ start:175 stop:1251 length:1077 start_codon:yes stop_codon:yes gene_type:complete